MKSILLISALLPFAVGFSCSSGSISANNPQIQTSAEQKKIPEWLHHINVDEAFLSLKKKDPPMVLDIRTPFEYDGGRIKGAKLLNYYDKDFNEALGQLDKTKLIMVHCRSGGRSSDSLDVFEKLGFQNVLHLDGGILAWKKAGYPLIKD